MTGVNFFAAELAAGLAATPAHSWCRQPRARLRCSIRREPTIAAANLRDLVPVAAAGAMVTATPGS